MSGRLGAVLGGVILAAVVLQPAPVTGQAAQPERPAAPQPASPVLYGQQSAEQVREQLHDILAQHPPTLWQVLRLDPALLSDATYLSPYPALAQFLKAHPDVARNPRYYVGTPNMVEFTRETDPGVARMRVVREMLFSLLFLTGFLSVVGTLGFLLKSGIEYRRWLRLSKVQTDVHTKLVDRFTSGDELLAYVQSPAGRRFLEAGPAPDEPATTLRAPFGRILWSLQAGTVAAAFGVGLLLVSRYLSGDANLAEASPVAFVLGAIVIAIGVGFLVSAVLAFFLSRRLGLIELPASSPSRG